MLAGAMKATAARAAGAFAALPVQMAQLAEALRVKREPEAAARSPPPIRPRPSPDEDGPDQSSRPDQSSSPDQSGGSPDEG